MWRSRAALALALALALAPTLQRACEPVMQPNVERYFAFGANQHPATLRRRNVRTVSARPARLRGHRLVFDVGGVPMLEPAFASVQPDPSDDLWGVLYDLCEEDLARLRGFEGIAYDEAGVEVETAHGLEPARTFVARHPKKPRRPSARYLGVIIAGARHHGLPPEWIARLEAEPRLYVPGLHELWRGVWALADVIHRLGTRPSARR